MMSSLRLSAVLVFWLVASVSWADPRADYLLHCGGCHLPNGVGAPPEVPTLINTLGPIVSSPEGRDYIVRVPGASQTPLNDARLAEVMNWVLSTFNADTLGTSFKALTGPEVGRSRRQVLADPKKLRRSLWPDYE
jgi:hypothetical protein